MSGVLRIRGKTSTRAAQTVGADGSANDYDSYLSRLLKLIPAEVIALYLVGRGLIPQDKPVGLFVWSVVALVGVVLVRCRATRKPGVGPQWRAVGIAAVSFVVWIYSLGDVFAVCGIYIPWVGSLLVLAWTFFIPYVYKADE